jgi:hypothetical protein
VSHCTTASCLAHKREMFLMIWCPRHEGPGLCPHKGWVHLNCFPCDALAGIEIAEGDLE